MYKLHFVEAKAAEYRLRVCCVARLRVKKAGSQDTRGGEEVSFSAVARVPSYISPKASSKDANPLHAPRIVRSWQGLGGLGVASVSFSSNVTHFHLRSSGGGSSSSRREVPPESSTLAVDKGRMVQQTAQQHHFRGARTGASRWCLPFPPCFPICYFLLINPANSERDFHRPYQAWPALTNRAS